MVAPPVTGDGCVEDCNCHGESRCKPCSRFEMGRQVHECMRTGYRQWAYCWQEKVSKYVRWAVDDHVIVIAVDNHVCLLQLPLSSGLWQAQSLLAVPGQCYDEMHKISQCSCALFQVMMLLLGSVSSAVVHWRQNRIERIMAYRIDQQIRAWLLFVFHLYNVTTHTHTHTVSEYSSGFLIIIV